MTSLLSCRNGHHWEGPADAVCPECGAAAEPQSRQTKQQAVDETLAPSLNQSSTGRPQHDQTFGERGRVSAPRTDDNTLGSASNDDDASLVSESLAGKPAQQDDRTFGERDRASAPRTADDHTLGSAAKDDDASLVSESLAGKPPPVAQDDHTLGTVSPVVPPKSKPPVSSIDDTFVNDPAAVGPRFSQQDQTLGSESLRPRASITDETSASAIVPPKSKSTARPNAHDDQTLNTEPGRPAAPPPSAYDATLISVSGVSEKPKTAPPGKPAPVQQDATFGSAAELLASVTDDTFGSASAVAPPKAPVSQEHTLANEPSASGPVSQDDATFVSEESRAATPPRRKPPATHGKTLADAPSASGPVSQDDETFVNEPSGGPSSGSRTSPPSAGSSGSRTAPVSAHEETLAPPSAASRATVRHGPPSVKRAEAIPGYEILGTLGRGGMGVVYKARQVKLNRLVALKMILSAAHAGPEDLARFQLEAEAVARLQHPNIVQVFEVGKHDGRPYCALELVDGGSLQDLLKKEPPGLRTAAEMVEILARAVDHAHRHGIVHRDLKPGNVLLGARKPAEESTAVSSKKTAIAPPHGSSEPPLVLKITDFGLAKRIDTDIHQTGTGSVLGTPAYMAPEQAAGRNREIGPPADIYALGAILYDLLVGKPPLRGESVVDTLQLVQTVEPVAPRKLQPKVPRDLETICLKCLQKAPASRYASAEALADDLRRFLNGEPILARPVPAWERAAKWARRRPAAAALLVVSCAAAIALAVGGWAYARLETERATEALRLRGEANEQRDQAVANKKTADRERDQAIRNKEIAEDNFRHAREAVELMLTRVGQEKLANEPRMEKVRRDLLAGALDFYQRFLKERGNDPLLRWETARAYQRVGDIHEMLGEDDEAETAYRASNGLLTKLQEESPDNADYRRDHATTLNNLGNLLNKNGRLKEAEQAYSDAMALRGPLTTAADRREQATLDNNLATLLQTRHQFAQAEQAQRRALAVLGQLIADLPQQPQYRQEQARCLGNLGELLAKTGRLADAAKALESSRDTLQQLAAKNPTVTDYRVELAASSDRLGNLWRDSQPRKAEVAYRRALGLREELVADFPTVPAYRQALASSHNNLAIALQAAGKQPAADQAYRDALAVQEKLVADFPRIPAFRRELASSLNNRGILLQQTNRPAEAEKAYRDALARQEKLADEFPQAPEYRQDQASALINLTVTLEATQRPTEAEEACKKGLALREKLVADSPRVPAYRQELGRGALQLGTLYQLHGKPKEAAEEYGKAVAVFTELAERWPDVPDYRHELAVVLQNRAQLLQATKRGAEAEPELRRAADLLGALAEELPGVPAYRQEQARALNELAIVLSTGEHRTEAQAKWAQAIALQEKLAAEFPDQPVYKQELARSLSNRGILEVRLGQNDKAEESFGRSEKQLQELTTKYPNVLAVWQDLINTQQNLANLLNALGRREAEAAWERLIASQKSLAKLVPNDPSLTVKLAQGLVAAGEFFEKRGQNSKAATCFANAEAEYRALVKKDPKQLAWRQGLGRTLLAQAEFQIGSDDDAAAAKAIRELVPLIPLDGPDVLRAAGVLCKCAELVAKDSKLAKEERSKREQAYLTEAVGVLRQAVAAGYRDVPAFKSAAALDPLRQRADVQKLLAEMEKPKKP
jgi:tetratricopeptide (TPR) repeat protein/tRNA A-37 threonylcarbamoyl transferase component Bud32